MKRETHFVFSTHFAEVTQRSEGRAQLRGCAYQKLQISQQILSHVI
ncbi:hypothetical protein ABIC76_001433 [Ralstonia sp. 1138]